MDRPNKEIQVSTSDFKELVKSTPLLSDNTLLFDKLCNSLFQEAKQSQNEKQSYILWLLADISEISFCKDGRKTFEASFSIFGQGRSMIPSDLSTENLNFLKSIYEYVPNKMLKARIADLLWDLKIQPRDTKYAEFVINTYLDLPFSEHDSFYKNQLFIKRALQLAGNMKKNDVIMNFENKIYKVFTESQYDGYAYLLHLADFMIENSLCSKQAKDISEKLELFGEKLEIDNSYNLAGSYYSSAAFWINKIDENKAIEIQMKNAKASIHHAESVATDDKQGISETAFYEEALKIIRALPKDKRRKFISETEEKNIADKIRNAGQKCLTNMGKFSLPIDLTECITQIESHIRGKSKEEALEFLALTSSNITYEGIKESSIKILKDSPLFSLVSKQFYGSDGRIVARTKGYDSKKPLTPEDENVWQWMIFEYQNYIQIHVVGIILPELQIFNNEHNMSYKELNEIVSKSNIFPNDRKGIITKGLLAGFEYDFITALHLLCPQIENMVRYQLRLANIKTSCFDKEGIETENGLSTLVKDPEFDKIFGKDLGFEIKALMCDSFGPNLRNNVAHGLLDINQMQSHHSVYLWWFCLRLVYIEFWNSFRKE